MYDLTSPLDGFRSPFGATRGFNPSVLFALSEPGVWLDPSDLSTLFQDTAGTTPVTAAGQSVALVLDKSQGLRLGPELVVNGGFATDTDWTKGAGWTISGGVATTAAATSGNLDQTMVLVAGRAYLINYTVTGWVSGQAVPSFGGGTAVFGALSGASNGVKSCVMFAATGNTSFRITKNASADSFSIDNISVRELPGNHATQTTAGARPTYQVDATGRGYLQFDGVDDWLVTPTITPGTDKVQMFVGVRKLSDAATGIVAELSAATSANNGSFHLAAPSLGLTYGFFSRGTVRFEAATPSAFPAPITTVLTGIGDISGDNVVIRANGVQAGQNTGDQGTGNYLAYPMYIGRRGGTSLPLNGRIYGLIVRFGANLTADQISRTETWVNSKTGAY